MPTDVNSAFILESLVLHLPSLLSQPRGTAAGVARRGDEIVVFFCGPGVLGLALAARSGHNQGFVQPRPAKQATADHITGKVG